MSSSSASTECAAFSKALGLNCTPFISSNSAISKNIFDSSWFIRFFIFFWPEKIKNKAPRRGKGLGPWCGGLFSCPKFVGGRVKAKEGCPQNYFVLKERWVAPSFDYTQLSMPSDLRIKHFKD